MAQSASDTSLDSESSITAGDVLIRSTSIQRSRGTGRPGQSHQIQQESPGAPYIPPALSANRAPGPRAVSGPPQTEIICEQPPLPISVDPHMLTEAAHLKMEPKSLAEQSSPKNNDVNNESSSRPKEHVCISHEETGQKEVLRACVKQRVHETSESKEVKVKLLQDITAEKRDNRTEEKNQELRNLDSAGIIAAATAAAIATAAPLLKAQSDLDSKIGSVSELISKLQADQQQLHSTEQLAKIQTQSANEHWYQERMGKLECKLEELMEHRMQQMEALQQQQIDFQSRFLSSAISTGGVQGVRANGICAIPSCDTAKPIQRVSGHKCRDVLPVSKSETHVSSSRIVDAEQSVRKSPLETPAPRRFAPVPMSKDVGVLLKDKPLQLKGNAYEPKCTTSLEKGRFLEQILHHTESPSNYSAQLDVTPVTRTKPNACQDRSVSIAWSDEPAAATTHAFKGVVPSRSKGNSAVQKANDVLYEIGKLKSEMERVLQETSQENFDLNGGNKTKDFFYWNKNRDYQPSSAPSLLQTTKAPKSMFEDAEKILRQIKNNKKILEDNLEAILRAKDGSAVYSAISALSTDGNAMENVRIKSTVDAWIKEIGTEIHEEMVRKEKELVKYNQNNQELVIAKKAQDIKCAKSTQKRINRLQPSTVREPKKLLSDRREDISSKSNLRTQFQKKEVHFKAFTKSDEVSPPTEKHIAQLYGKPIYQSHRSTLKKGPYLRFNSPSPKSKPQRPKVVEIVRGVKVRAVRTQTRSSSMRMLIVSPKQPSVPSQLLQENQYVFTPSREMPAFSGPQEGHLIPMAIPLGQSQIDVAATHPASVVLMRPPHPVTVTTTISPSLPKPHPKVQKPNIAVIEMKSEKKDPPKLSIEVLPSVDIDSIGSESTDSVVIPPSPEVVPPSVPVETLPQTPEHVQSEEDFIAFPGTKFIDVTDITQEIEEEVPEAALEYNGWSGPEPNQYNGIPFPPTVPSHPPATDVLNNIIERRETLENRLINWVEQEVMARMISEMYPVQRETVPNVVSDSSESDLHTSDIVDTVGGEGLQLFVDAGVPMDSTLVRQLVNEAVAETVAVMLGEREQSKVETAPDKTFVDMSTRTPLATPRCTPPRTPSPPKIEQLAIKTPVMSPQTSGSEDDEGKTPIKTEQSQLDNRSLVGTPAVTPVSTPPPVSTPTPPPPPPPVQVTDTIDMPSRMQPLPWGDVDLPLEEENPTSLKDEALHKEPIVMSVAKEEDPESLISAPSPETKQPPVSPTPDVRSPPQVRSPSSSPTTVDSSSTVTITETDTPDRPISEGELLYSYGQLVAAKALAEGGLIFANVNASLSSTLRDAHEMEFDPPSEGQVIQRPHQGHHRDPVLSLLVKLNQAPIISEKPVCDHEISDEDDSLGELSEGQRPKLTIAAESVLLGHSVHLNPLAAPYQPKAPQSRPLRSPGQCDEPSGTGFGVSDTSLGPLSLGELGTDTGTLQQPTQRNGIHSAPTAVKDNHQEKVPRILLVEARAAPARIIQVGPKGAATQQEGSLRDLDRTHIEPGEYLTSLLAGPAETRSDVQTTSGKRTLTLSSMTEDDHQDNVHSLQDDAHSSGADTF